MSPLKHKTLNRVLRRQRVRAKVYGDPKRPRLSIKISNRHIIAQIIDDTKSVSLVSVSTVGKKSLSGSLTDRAAWVGEEIAKQAKAAKIGKVVLDRGSRLYHGRVKQLADSARNNGLEF